MTSFLLTKIAYNTIICPPILSTVLTMRSTRKEEQTYQYLRVILETGSISQAAKRLHVSQPYLSQFITRIEEEEGTSLLDRTARPLVLTNAGEIFMECAEQIMHLRHRRRKQIEDITKGVRGHVRIGASHYRETFFLTEVLPRFRQAHPRIELSFEEGTTHQLEEYALHGVTDFSLVLDPLHFDALTFEPLYEERLLLAIAADHPIALRHPKTPDREFTKLSFTRLHQEPFIIIKEGQQLRSTFFDLCHHAHAQPKVILESESLVAALALASAGLGATLVTETLARRSVTRHPMRFFCLAGLPHRTVVAAYRRHRYLSKAAKILIAFMKEIAQQEFIHG